MVYIQYTCWSMNVVICWCSWKTAVQSKSILHDSSSFLSTTDFLIKFLLHNDFPFLWFFKSFYLIKFMLASSFSFSSVQIYKRYITSDFVLLQNQWSIESRKYRSWTIIFFQIKFDLIRNMSFLCYCVILVNATR